jgi:predicted glycoside hydrolase/deacetylase ChbG (UPF0249 family)
MHPVPHGESLGPGDPSPRTGALIINADDWGCDRETTDRILECAMQRTISSASGMVFMEDSERAGDFAREKGIDIGLHLNLTEAFSGRNVPVLLQEHHGRVARYLLRHRLSQTLYHPGLANSFEYVTRAQLEEFHRIYGEAPRRIDGHHHMHLCQNVMLGKLLPEGTVARRNFSFQPAEKSGVNRLYRGLVDRQLAKRHRITDFFFSLPPLEPAERLERIFATALHSVVEVETHPVHPEEYRFLAGGEIFVRVGDLQIASRFISPERDFGKGTAANFKP